MTVMIASNEDVLKKHIRDLLRTKVDAAGDNGPLVRRLLEQLDGARAALEACKPDSTRFKGKKFRHAIDAIVAYLKEQGEPLTEDDIIQGVIAGGWGTGTEAEKNPIFSSIRVHVKGTGLKANAIRKIGDLVGLYEWVKTDENGIESWDVDRFRL